jgi:hypothetical protein
MSAGLPAQDLPSDVLDQIAASPGWRECRVQALDTPAGRVVVKGQRPARGPWRYRALNALAGVLRMPLLKAAPAYGGPRAQAIEVNRLRSLAAAGLPVPPLLHVADDHIVLRHVGRQSLVDLLQDPDQDALALWLAGLRALAQVHRRGQYLSQAFARNFLLHQGQVVFIDFEDDPLEVMLLEQAQLRDWLAYLHSTLWLLHVPQAQLLAAWHEQLATLPPELAAQLTGAARRLGWLRRLPASRRRWGRDVVSLRALGVFLHAWAGTGR